MAFIEGRVQEWLRKHHSFSTLSCTSQGAKWAGLGAVGWMWVKSHPWSWSEEQLASCLLGPSVHTASLHVYMRDPHWQSCASRPHVTSLVETLHSCCHTHMLGISVCPHRLWSGHLEACPWFLPDSSSWAFLLMFNMSDHITINQQKPQLGEQLLWVLWVPRFVMEPVDGLQNPAHHDTGPVCQNYLYPFPIASVTNRVP